MTLAARIAGMLLRALIGFGVLAGIAPVGADEAGKAPLTVIADDNYPPYLFRDENGVLQGYLADLWRLWGTRTGNTVELVGADWATAQKEFAAGRARVIDTIFRTPEREGRYDFSPPYAAIAVNVYVHRSIGGIVDAKSLRGFVVGVKEGDACVERLKATGAEGQAAFPSYQQLVAAAAAGEVKVFCMDGPPAEYLLYRARAHRQFRAAFSLFTGQLHRAVRPGDQPALALVENGFSRISADEIRGLEQKWLEAPVDLEPLEKSLLWGLLAAGGSGP
ncbi:MAG: transporter substrate-binding domain-containing protein [Dechloromonas sp.]|nr:transporter substrate-binding domain-containing protein [Dechloromonas sp.]